MTTLKATHKVEQVSGTRMNLIGEGPFFDQTTSSLYWCDLIGGHIFRLDTTTEIIYTAKVVEENYISFIIPVKGTIDQFVVGAGERLLLIKWDGVNTLAEVIRVYAELPVDGVRFNDAKTDNLGRLYLGTMINKNDISVFDDTKRIGSLYRFTMAEGLVELKTNIGLANGLAFNDKTSTFYFIDSYDLNIKQYQYDEKTGSVTNEKILIDISTYGSPKSIFPDGMTIDNEGNLYVAMCGGSKILKVNTE